MVVEGRVSWSNSELGFASVSSVAVQSSLVLLYLIMLKKFDPCIKKSFLRYSDSLGVTINEESVAVAM